MAERQKLSDGFEYSVYVQPDWRIYVYRTTPKAWGENGGRQIKYLAPSDDRSSVKMTAERVQATYESLRPPFAECRERIDIDKLVDKLRKMCDNSSYGEEAIDYATMRLKRDKAEANWLAEIAGWCQDINFISAVHKARMTIWNE